LSDVILDKNIFLLMATLLMTSSTPNFLKTLDESVSLPVCKI